MKNKNTVDKINSVKLNVESINQDTELFRELIQNHPDFKVYSSSYPKVIHIHSSLECSSWCSMFYRTLEAAYWVIKEEIGPLSASHFWTKKNQL